MTLAFGLQDFAFLVERLCVGVDDELPGKSVGCWQIKPSVWTALYWSAFGFESIVEYDVVEVD